MGAEAAELLVWATMSTVQELISVECHIAQEWLDCYEAPCYAERYADEYVYVPVIPYADDEIVHTEDRPFCMDLSCPCHDDIDLLEEVAAEVENGLLTSWEFLRTLNGLQI